MSTPRRFVSPLALATLLFAALPGTIALAQEKDKDKDAAEPTLKVGSPAPALHVSKWVQGTPVAKFEKGKVYVVEFWATWCGPCKAVIPHMSQLNTKYKDKGVTFIGVDIWEDDAAAVAAFVQEMGDKMNYNIAIDDGGVKGKTAAAWMTASGEGGIPTAFIVGRDATIQWIGHPSAIERPLGLIVAGEFDADKQADLNKRREQIMRRFVAAQQNGDAEAMLGLIDDLAAVDEAFAEGADAFRFHLLLKLHRYDEAYKLAAELVDGCYKDNAEGIDDHSWTILDEEGLERRDYALSLRVAQRAVEVSESKDAAILDTLARAYFDTGKITEAVKYQRMAVERSDEQMRDELKATLEKYEQATQVN